MSKKEIAFYPNAAAFHQKAIGFWQKKTNNRAISTIVMLLFNNRNIYQWKHSFLTIPNRYFRCLLLYNK